MTSNPTVIIPEGFKNRIQKILELDLSGCESMVGVIRTKNGVIVQKKIVYDEPSTKILCAQSLASMTASIRTDIEKKKYHHFLGPEIQIHIDIRLVKLLNYLGGVDGARWPTELHPLLERDFGFLYYTSLQLYHVSKACVWISAESHKFPNSVSTWYAKLEEACKERHLIPPSSTLGPCFIESLQTAPVDRVAFLEQEIKQKNKKLEELEEELATRPSSFKDDPTVRKMLTDKEHQVEVLKNTLGETEGRNERLSQMLNEAQARIRELENPTRIALSADSPI